MVREGAIQLEVQRDDLERQLGQEGVAQHRRSGEAGHAVACVHNYLERPGSGEVHQLAEVLGVVLQDVVDADQAALGAAGMEPSLRYFSARAWISLRPDSEEMGCAPAFDILMPLYSAGLWLAVNVAPAALREPQAK
ncbi:hypothetical protein AHiyo4_07500 [Arthrobacter sp. Hiyo4]|nr:hypothetical protein AHiyo4_07500 [Arthrobacter sp. Hiyo4]